MSIAQESASTRPWLHADRAPSADALAPRIQAKPVLPAAPAVRRVEGRIEATDDAILPERCACCGDTLDLHPFRTLPGRVRYFVCQEHLISAVARLAVGVAMMLIAGLVILSGGVSGHKALAAFGMIGVGGAAMIWFAIPVRAGRAQDGWRTLRGVCRATAMEID